MTDTIPEFSRPVPLARLGFPPFRQQIEATPSEIKMILAGRFTPVELASEKAVNRTALVMTI